MNSLHQTGKKGEAQDGMDIALCVIDKQQMKVQYAGAYNPMYLIRKVADEKKPVEELVVSKHIRHKTYKHNNAEYEFYETRADRMPVGIYYKKMNSFTNHEVKVKPNDTLYIFSDGYADQFGGGNGRKFLSTHFKKLLIEIQDYSLLMQKEILKQTLKDWRGNIEQVDDILIVGIKL